MAVGQPSTFAVLLKEYRSSAGLTQEELAERAGVSVRGISNLERGLNRSPHPGTIRRLADALELTPDQRTDFIAAGTHVREGEGAPAVPVTGSAIGRFSRRAIGFLVVALCLILLASAALVAVLRLQPAASSTAAVHSTAQAPALLGAWGSASGTSPLGSTVGLVVPVPAGSAYVLGYGAGVARISAAGRQLTSWNFPGPTPRPGIYDVKVDAKGVVWVSMSDDTVRAYSPDGRLLESWGGSGVDPGRLSAPSGLGIARNGDIVVAEGGNHRVQVLTPTGRPIRGWPGPESNPQTFQPSAIAMDRDDDVSILDLGNRQIEKYSLQGKLLATLHVRDLNGAMPSALSFTADRDGNLYVLVVRGTRWAIDKLSRDGKGLGRWTSFQTRPSLAGPPSSLRFDGSNTGYATIRPGRVLKIDENGKVVASWSLRRLKRPLFESPQVLAVKGTDTVYVTDFSVPQRIVRLSTTTGSVTQWNAPISAMGAGINPSGITVEPNGNILAVNRVYDRVDTYTPAGKLLGWWGSSGTGDARLFFPSSIATAHDGTVSVLDRPSTLDVKTFTPSGRLRHSWCVTCSSATGNVVNGLTVDARGNVYVLYPDQVIEYSSAGLPLRSWGGSETLGRGGFFDTGGVGVDSRGNVYVSDTGQRMLEVFSPTGKRIAYWQTVSPGGPRFTAPGAVAIDARDDIWLLDGLRLKELAPLQER